MKKLSIGNVNAGHAIIAIVPMNNRFGGRDTHFLVTAVRNEQLLEEQFVTWECAKSHADGNYRFYWGHYFFGAEDNFSDAIADMIGRRGNVK